MVATCVPSNLSLALIGCLHVKPMIIGNYLSLNKKRKVGVCDSDMVSVLCLFKMGESNREEDDGRSGAELNLIMFL